MAYYWSEFLRVEISSHGWNCWGGWHMYPKRQRSYYEHSVILVLVCSFKPIVHMMLLTGTIGYAVEYFALGRKSQNSSVL